MKLIITHKIFTAQRVANIIGASSLIGKFKEGAFYEGNNYVVTCYVGWTLQCIPEDGIIRISPPRIRPYEEIVELPEYKKQYDLLQKLMIDERFEEIVLLVDTEEERDNGMFHYLYKKYKIQTSGELSEQQENKKIIELITC